jgi:transcriptional regulator with XRE-family HTH domain
MSSSPESKLRSGSPGGARLRALRERSGRAQLWVEAESELGTGYLQRVESGRVAQPSRATVERVLDALGVRYDERREVLALFGYAIATASPTAAELAWAREVSQPELDAFPFPAYALDCANRLVAANRVFARLFDAGSSDARVAELLGRSMLAPWFDPASPLGGLLVEPDTVLPALVHAFRYELQRLRAEPWFEREVLAPLLAIPSFRREWDLVRRQPAPHGAARALVPLRLRVPKAGVLEFRLSSEPFARDPRFRSIYYMPGDPPTLRWCASSAGDPLDATG